MKKLLLTITIIFTMIILSCEKPDEVNPYADEEISELPILCNDK